MFNFIAFFAKAFKYSTVFLFGSTGEIVTEKSGHLNMGTPGIMYLGALGGLLGTRIYLDSLGKVTDYSAVVNPAMVIFMSILFAMIFAMLAGLLFSFFTVTLKCNQNVTGLTLTTFGVGISCYFIGEMNTKGMSAAGLAVQSLFPNWEQANAGWFGEIFLSQSFYTYLAIIVAIAAMVIISFTRIGLNLRAVGENPASADAAGVNVNLYRYLATIIGAAIVGIGGISYELDFMKGMFNVADNVDALGWLALSLVIFSLWKPVVAIFTSFVFGALMVLPVYLPAMFNGQLFLFKIVPYILTIVVLIITSIIDKKGGLGPEGLGQTYFREDR